MSHEITAIDQQEGIEMGWHKLTIVKPDLQLSDCWLSKWDIQKKRLSLEGVETDYCMLTVTDNPKIQIGSPVHCETYQPVTNKDFLELIGDATETIKGAKIASVGSVCARGRVFVSVKLEQLEGFKAADRDFKGYLNFLNSHDQSSAFVVNTSNICTVCNNTFSMNLHSDEGDVRVKLKHTKNIALKLENVAEVVEGYLGAQAQFKKWMDKFRTRPIRRESARALFAGIIGGSAGDDGMSTRKINQVDRLQSLFISGNGNRGNDLSDVFSAVTDYYTHESSGGDDRSRQLVSSEFGSGQTAKARTFSLLQKPDLVRSTIVAGQKLLLSTSLSN